MEPAAEGVPTILRPDLEGGVLHLLDQSRLPDEVRYLPLRDVDAAARAIVNLEVRGAPAIGVVGAFALALGIQHLEKEEGLDAGERTRRAGSMVRRLAEARPTGRNLGWALATVYRAFEAAVASGEEAGHAAAESARAVWRTEAERCRLIGLAGLEILPSEGCSILTHCNAGALATGGVGTATAPIYLAVEKGIPVRVFAGETRPVLQGARLTAWELGRAGVDVTVVTDSMVGALMASGAVDLVIVGADAVTLDGSVANKIGTYAIAVLARHHGLPLYVAMPGTTVESGVDMEDVPIEHRDEGEVRRLGGRLVVPPGAKVWNPAFDVTPPDLVTAFLTEEGVIRPPYGPRIEALARACLEPPNERNLETPPVERRS